MKITKSLKGNFNIRKTLKYGKNIRKTSIGIYVLENKNKSFNYLAITLSKKNGNSVIRNKIKRWIREIYKKNEYELETGNNIIFMLKRNVIGKQLVYKDLEKQITDLLKEYRMFKNEKNK